MDQEVVKIIFSQSHLLSARKHASHFTTSWDCYVLNGSSPLAFCEFCQKVGWSTDLFSILKYQWNSLLFARFADLRYDTSFVVLWLCVKLYNLESSWLTCCSTVLFITLSGRKEILWRPVLQLHYRETYILRHAVETTKGEVKKPPVLWHGQSVPLFFQSSVCPCSQPGPLNGAGTAC